MEEKGGTTQAINIDSEFKTLIPPLTDDEYRRLEQSILDEGLREPIITWNGTIIDGHNRYSICQKHGIGCPNIEREFESRDAARIWIYSNQLGRRNLEPGQKAALVIERNEAEVREQARIRKLAGKQIDLGVHGPQGYTEAEKGRTHEILARQAGVSETTVKRVLGVKHRCPELYDKVRSGEITARKAYRQVTNEKKPKSKRFTDDGRRICSECGEPISEGEYYNSKPSMHKKCHHARTAAQIYKFPDKSLIENVPTYNPESLFTELTLSAKSLHDSWKSSIRINESMGVRLTARQKKRFEKAAEELINAIEKTRKEYSDD